MSTPVSIAKPGVSLDQTISQIVTWFSKAVPDPTERNVHTQLSVHIEEVTEMLEVLANSGNCRDSREQLAFSVDVSKFLSKRLKAGETGVNIDFTTVDRVELLDSFCDQIVTAIGMAHMLKMDIIGGLKEVANSNDSKFDEDGNPIFDIQGKIIKGDQYFRPDLTLYV